MTNTSSRKNSERWKTYILKSNVAATKKWEALVASGYAKEVSDSDSTCDKEVERAFEYSVTITEATINTDGHYNET
jgi:hypothetical protein